jgi:hypothetical protein
LAAIVALIRRPGEPLSGAPPSALIPTSSWRAGGKAKAFVGSPNPAMAIGFVAVGALVGFSNPVLFVVYATMGVGIFAAWAAFDRGATIRRWSVERSFNRIPLVGTAADVARGARVRLTGVVQPHGQTLATWRGGPAVVVRYIGTRELRLNDRSVRRWDLHAVDFTLVLGDDSKVLVRVDDLVFLPHPPLPTEEAMQARAVVAQVSGGDGAAVLIYAQEALVPGQRVTVAGTLDFTVDPAGAAASDRQPRLLPTLRSEAGRPVYVSAVPEAELRQLNPR